MNRVERIIPNYNKIIVSNILFGFDEKTDENYLTKIVAFEKKCEQSLIETLSRVNINASVKTDRYSLPYQKEVSVTLNGESYMNGPYEFFKVARNIVKVLLNEDPYKIRFYLFINLEEGHFGFGKVIYKFRYYVH